MIFQRMRAVRVDEQGDDLPTPADLARIVETQQAERVRKALEQTLKAEQEKRQARTTFLSGSLPEGYRQALRQKLRRAAETGSHELEVLHFPAEYCTDGGVAINNYDTAWQRTLQGLAKRALEAWEGDLKPLGYRIKAKILSYPGGMLGEVGLFLYW